MLTQERKQLLLDRLRRDGRLVAKDLSAELDVSEDTIRRDLRELAGEGMLTRVHGGAMPASPTVANLDVRRTLASTDKQLLGRAGAELVERDQMVFIDGGTTNLELVKQLPLNLKATVATHSPQIATALEHHAGVDLIVIGGSLLRHSMVCIGSKALEAISRMRFDLFFLGVTALHEDEGATTGCFEEAEIKREIVNRSAEVVTLLTTDKLGAISPFTICPLDHITSIIMVNGKHNGPHLPEKSKVVFVG
jgi:DeoR/GlpR family transcriptional regulator of sugar metabolism